MENKKEIINITYACDNNYIPQTGISILSLLENNKESEIRLILVSLGVNKENIELISNLSNKYRCHLEILEFDDLCADLRVADGIRHPKSIYVKLFLHKIDVHMSRIIYLDSDTIICDSLYELWNTDMDNKCIAGTMTTCKTEVKESLGLNKSDEVINDGILMMDLNKWREKKYEEKCIEFIEKFYGQPPVLSEGTLNAVCHNDIYILHPRYNVHGGLALFTRELFQEACAPTFYEDYMIKEAVENPTIVHYVGNLFIRPWYSNSNHPMKKYYDKYRRLSPWKNDTLSRGKVKKRIAIIVFLNQKISPKLYMYICKLYKKVKFKEKANYEKR